MRAALALALLTAAGPALAQQDAGYPTEARAEYVLTCMAANGQTRKALSECSCAIDHIAQLMDYDDYVAAETVLRMRQVSGERAAMFKDGAFSNTFARELHTAEAEAEILCFTPGT